MGARAVGVGGALPLPAPGLPLALARTVGVSLWDKEAVPEAEGLGEGAPEGEALGAGPLGLGAPLREPPPRSSPPPPLLCEAGAL